MADAAEGHAAAAAENAAAVAAATHGGSSSSSAAGGWAASESANARVKCNCAASVLSIFFHLATLWQGADGAAACLQAAPAAVQLILTVFETSDVHRQATLSATAVSDWQQAGAASFAAGSSAASVQPVQDSPVSLLLDSWEGVQVTAMRAAYNAFWVIADALTSTGRYAGQPPPAPSTLQFRLSPELSRCLDLTICVTAVIAAQELNSSSSSHGSTTSAGGGGRAVPRRPLEQGSRPQAASAGRQSAAPGKSSSNAAASDAAASSGAGFSFPVSPLSSKLFDLLGISQATVLLAASHMRLSSSLQVRSLQAVGKLHSDLLKLWATDPTVPITQSRVVHMETGFLLSLLVLQWADSLPGGLAEEVCSNVAVTAFNLCAAPLNTLLVYRGSVEVVLPASAAKQLMLLTPAASTPTGERQQGGSGHAAAASSAEQQQQLQQDAQSASEGQQRFLLLPPTPVVAELVPLLLRVCRTRLLLLHEGQAPPPPGPRHGARRAAGLSAPSADPSTGPDSRTLRLNAGLAAYNCAQMLAYLLQASQLKQPSRGGTESVNATLEALAAAVHSRQASSSPAGGYLHSHEVFAANAVDILTLQEGELRSWLRKEAGIAALVAAEQHLRHRERQVTVMLLLASTAAAGSAVLRQCYSLLSTLQKLTADQAGSHDPNSRARLSLTVAKGAAGVLAHDLDMHQQPEKQSQQAASLVVCAAASLLPSLVIIGRCFLQAAAQLQADLPEQQLQQLAESCFGVQSQPSGVARLVHAAQPWLLAHRPRLATADFPSCTVLQQLGQLGSALKACRSICSDGASTSNQGEAFAAAVQQLQLAGAALTSLAVPCLCNNPACSNAAGMSELGLVSGRSCRVARYCSRACQRTHWKQHKPACAALVAAAAAAKEEEDAAQLP